MNRRAFIAAAAAAVPVAGAAASEVHPPLGVGHADTPILRLFHEIEAISARAAVYETGLTGEEEDAELERLFYDRRDRLVERMMALPCTCAADFAAKVITDTCHGDAFDDWETGTLWKEARALTGVAS